MGSPPRARGAADAPRAGDRRRGITPACAGSRDYALVHRPNLPDHPRVRGEQRRRGSCATTGSGSPPACAGSSGGCGDGRADPGDHPRVRGEQGTVHDSRPTVAGSPPRARGAACRRTASRSAPGITPACAGSSPPPPRSRTPAADHPRVRGEQISPFWAPRRAAGSPPRARGAEDRQRHHGGDQRITPAYAGSRSGSTCRRSALTDHPRVRGEQTGGLVVPGGHRGSPPRARGAGPRDRPRPPRVRGEQNGGDLVKLHRTGSPPRARGAARDLVCVGRGSGITPACAGSSTGPAPAGSSPGDHPRVRGEQGLMRFTPQAGSGSPPRARGAGLVGQVAVAAHGITPACAGSSGRPGPGRRSSRDHPRVRGEQRGSADDGAGARGSPPRARGAVGLAGAEERAAWITPACAGSRRSSEE